MLLLKIFMISLSLAFVAWLWRTYYRRNKAQKQARALRDMRMTINRRVEHIRWYGGTAASSVYQMEMYRAELALIIWRHGEDNQLQSAIRDARWRLEDAMREAKRYAQRGWDDKPYATDDELAHACDVLGIDASVTVQAIHRAYKRAIAPYNLALLRQQNPPAGVLETARKRKLEAYKALRLLRGLKRFEKIT